MQEGAQSCIFLNDGKKCSIYGARPMQCQTYPWWPELMREDVWALEGAEVCEGINHPDASSGMDVAAAVAQLQRAVAYFGEQQVAGRSKRSSKGGEG